MRDKNELVDKLKELVERKQWAAVHSVKITLDDYSEEHVAKMLCETLDEMQKTIELSKTLKNLDWRLEGKIREPGEWETKILNNCREQVVVLRWILERVPWST